jgi:hypothetical protein
MTNRPRRGIGDVVVDFRLQISAGILGDVGEMASPLEQLWSET